MKTKRLLGAVFALLLATMLGRAVSALASAETAGSIHRADSNDSPDVSERLDVTNTTAFTPQIDGPIIADHTVVDKYDEIPQEYIAVVKTMWLNVPGESHSSGYRYGLQLLEDLDPRFAVNVVESGSPEGPTDEHLRVNRAVRNEYNNWSWGAGEETYWTTSWAVNRIKNHIAYCNDTANNPVTAIGFGWCWDMTSPGLEEPPDPVYGCRWGGRSYYWNGVNTNNDYGAWGLDDGDAAMLPGDRVSLQTYLDAVDEIGTQDPNTVSFFTTGPVDGGGNLGESGYQRWLKHERIREYVTSSSDKVLFDYADILCWNDAGERHEAEWNGHTFQAIHLDNTGSYGSSHIGEAGCLRLGKAMWWLLARIAGWDGTPADSGPQKAASAGAATQNETITYTITIRDLAAPLTATVRMTDVVPSALAYISGTLSATSGGVDASTAPTLTWSGTLTPTPVVTVTYAITVATSDVQLITNTAVIAAQGYPPITRTATVRTGYYRVYLPLVLRAYEVADTQPPSVPQNFSAQAVSSSQINLNWDASMDNVGVAGYRIYRGGSELITTTQTSHSDTGLSPSTTCTYAVSAYDARGNESAQSATVSATTSITGGGAIIVDHNAVQQFDQIPDTWLDEARKLTIHYGHTSHGSQILSGLIFLQKVDGTKYTMNIQDEGNSQSGDVALPPGDRVPVSVASGGETTLRVTREGAWPYGYWWTSDALSGTKQVLSYDGGLFDVSGWAWCGQVSWCASYFNCENDQFIYDYFAALGDLEATFPDMRFFYMTGHVVGPHADTARRNDIIRDHCANNGKVLFDFADIESWDLDGAYHPETTESCEWCEGWCDDPSHADDVECQYEAELPPNSDICCGGAGCGDMTGCETMCAHSHGINCVIKAKAFWWMMARIAGWDGI
jgi:uncharacterized repeat protein (TIGR01451 family)